MVSVTLGHGVLELFGRIDQGLHRGWFRYDEEASINGRKIDQEASWLAQFVPNLFEAVVRMSPKGRIELTSSIDKVSIDRVTGQGDDVVVALPDAICVVNPLK